MDKEIRFTSDDGLGHCFAEAIDITRRAGGGLTKIAGQLNPQISVFLRTLRPDPKFQYVLMTPMGSFEVWGQNRNGDQFPELGLAYDRTSQNPLPVIKALEAKYLSPFGLKVPPGNYTNFGYKTFQEALRFLHHQNKRPEFSYGDIPLSTWNPFMHRVEVIVRHDREKAKLVGAEEVIRDIDEDKPREISMGAKVPFDVCCVCGHLSRTPDEYCDHLRLMMGSTLPDGRVVGALNLFPRFFDLSDVFVPAAPEAAVLLKVAQLARALPKTAQNKVADISKEVTPNTASSAMTRAADAEPDLPQHVLRSGGLGRLLSSLAALGIVLKPREFQDAALSRMGQGPLANSMWSNNEVFGSTPYAGSPAAFENPDFSFMRSLAQFIPQRSCLYPYLPQRILRVVVVGAQPSEKPATAEPSPILQKVAAAYSAYRGAFRYLPQLLSVATETDFGYYRDHFFQDLVTDSMEKAAARPSGSLFTPSVSMYVYNAHQGGAALPPASWDFQVSNQTPARALLFPVR